MHWGNIELYHIRSIAEFKHCNVAADDKLLHHHTNIQPLFRDGNARKWGMSDSEEDWRENIIHKPDRIEIFDQMAV